MTIHLEGEIVASRIDPVTQACFYTIERGGKRWTVEVPLADLHRHAANKQGRRTHVANALNSAMQGKPDD